MEYNITYRQKDKGWQLIISYKDENGNGSKNQNKVLKPKRS